MTAYDETRSTTTPTAEGWLPTPDDERRLEEIGRASCRERVCYPV